MQQYRKKSNGKILTPKTKYFETLYESQPSIYERVADSDRQKDFYSEPTDEAKEVDTDSPFYSNKGRKR